MKRTIGSYLFEILIIFAGITLSFLFEEWRTARQEISTRLELYGSMKNELIRVKELFGEEISDEVSKLNLIKMYLNHELADTSEFELIREITHELSHLQGMFSHINALANDNATRIADQPIIAKNLSFLGNMESDHERFRQTIQELTYQGIWPLLIKYHISEDLYQYRSNENELPLKGDYVALHRDQLFRAYLQLLWLKQTAIAGMDETILHRIDDIVKEIDSKILLIK